MAFFMQYVEVARQSGAVVDLAVTFVQVDELGRGGEIVAVGVQFVEQIHQVVGRGGGATAKVCLHIAIIALELARNLARRLKARHQMLARHGAARNHGIGVQLLGEDVHRLVHRRGKTELDVVTAQKRQALLFIARSFCWLPRP
jgi:GNAT superfamily N-acetyltransferase